MEYLIVLQLFDTDEHQITAQVTDGDGNQTNNDSDSKA